MRFPGATADRSDAVYGIVGAPLDISTTFQPGTRFGPNRIRKFGRSFEDYDSQTDRRFSNCKVYDHGNVEPGDDAEEYLTFLQGLISDFRHEGTIPLVLGGEHTVTVGPVRAIRPDVFVCLDAHLDLREEFAGNQYSHATVTRHTLEIADRAVILGGRAGSEAEWDRTSDSSVTVVPPEEVSSWTPNFDTESVYLSVDIDAADPGFAPGTGTMEPFGLTPREMRTVVRNVAPHADGFDIVEVNDRDSGQAAVLASKLLRTFVYEHADANL